MVSLISASARRAALAARRRRSETRSQPLHDADLDAQRHHYLARIANVLAYRAIGASRREPGQNAYIDARLWFSHRGQTCPEATASRRVGMPRSRQFARWADATCDLVDRNRSMFSIAFTLRTQF